MRFKEWGLVMKNRIMKKRAKRAFNSISRNDGTCHNILIYFYKRVLNGDGSKSCVYTSKPKINGGSGTPYRYVSWLKSLNISDEE